MMGGELVTSKNVLGFATPAHDFMQQRGGAAGVAAVQKRRETGEGLTRGLRRDNGLDNDVLFSPVVKQRDNLME